MRENNSFILSSFSFSFFPFALLLLFIINVYFTYLWRQSTICDTIVRLGKNRSMLASLSSYTYLLKNNKYFKFFLLTSNIKPKASQTQRENANSFSVKGLAYNFITSIIMVTLFVSCYTHYMIVCEKRKKTTPDKKKF